MDTTKIILITKRGEYTIEVEEDNLLVTEFVNRLFVPLLFAAGYSNEAIGDCFAC